MTAAASNATLPPAHAAASRVPRCNAAGQGAPGGAARGAWGRADLQ